MSTHFDPRTSADRRVRVQGFPVDSYPSIAPEAERGSVRRITVAGEEILHRPCAPVTAFGSDELTTLIEDMFATMYAASGVGLAANQVDVGRRLFVWDIKDDQGIRHVGHIANPVVDPVPAVFRTTIEANEGCLSVPGPYRDLVRASRAVVRGQDRNGRPLVIEASGYFARCVLHETDHLDGTLYIDHLTPPEREEALAEMERKRDGVLAERADRARSMGK